MTLLEEAAEFVAGLRLSAIPPRVIDRARCQTVSLLGAALAGARTREGAAALRVIAARGSRGAATLVGGAGTTHPVDAVGANAALSMTLDYDDYGFMGHTGHSAVWTALAVAEERGATIGELLVAQVAANELAGRLGAAVLFGPHNGQMWGHIHHGGGAAAAASLMGLDAERTADALALAFYQPNFTLAPGFMGSDAKILTAATPAQSGVTAAELAAAGLRGRRDILEDRRGLLRHFAWRATPRVLSGWGRAWVTDTLAFKIYPGCAYIDAAIDALLALDGARAIGRDQDVVIRASGLTLGMEMLGRPYRSAERIDPIAVNFSVRMSAAIALTAGRLTPVELGREWLDAHEEELRARVARVKLEHDLALSARMVAKMNRVLRFERFLVGAGDLGDVPLERLTFPFSAEVAAGGERRLQELPLGSPGRPFDETRRLCVDKLRRETAQADAVAALLERPDQPARALGELLRTATSVSASAGA